jgi:hypothetical protein
MSRTASRGGEAKLNGGRQMASNADGFKALRGGGVTGSTHSWGGGGIEGHEQRFESCLHGAQGGRPAVWTDGGGGFIAAW